MSDLALAGISFGVVAAWVFVGVVATTAYAVGRVKLKKKAMDEVELAWLVVGWPLTLFGALGLMVAYAAERVREQEQLRSAREGQVPTVRSGL